MDKLTVAALEATLSGPRPPVADALAVSQAELGSRARRIADRLDGIDVRVQLCDAAVGGGGAPGQPLPSAAVSLPAELAAALRSGAAVRIGSVPAVVGRIEDRRLLLDLRAVAAIDDELLIAAVMAAAG